LNIKKIINNLITNAIKHTKDGYVDVSIRLESIKVNHFNTKFILVGAQPVDGNMYLTFEVKDNGTGIPSDQLTSIFISDPLNEIQYINTSNFDVSGSGLPNLKYICFKNNSFLRYHSDVRN